MSEAGKIALALVGSLLASSCSCDDEPSASSRVQKVIGAGGGSITSEDGLLTMQVPPGAVDADVTFSIEPSDVAAPDGAMSEVYEIGPTGRQFAEPVTLVFDYDEGALAGRSPHGMRVGTFLDAVWHCEPMNAGQAASNRFFAAVMHLSTYVLHFIPCEANEDCQRTERCIDGGYCGVPCLDAADCPAPASCLDNVCIREHCDDGEACGGTTVCSAAEGPGVCLAGDCDDGADPLCGETGLYQQECTDEAHCIFDEWCGLDSACEGEDDCWRAWCVPPGIGCDCAAEGCPCEGGGGALDITGMWNYRYSCVEDAVCADECVEDRLTLVACPDDDTMICNQHVDGEWEIRGTLAGNVYTWVGGEPDVYEERGIWTFGADSFSGVTCYDYLLDGAPPDDCALGPFDGVCNDNGVRAPDPAPATHDPLPPCVCE